MPEGNHLRCRRMCCLHGSESSSTEVARLKSRVKQEIRSKRLFTRNTTLDNKGCKESIQQTQRLKWHLPPTWENTWLMIIYMFHILKVCKSKRRNRQTIKHEWRLDIRDLQEKHVLISVRTDGRAEDRQPVTLIIESRQQPPNPKARHAASMHKGKLSRADHGP